MKSVFRFASQGVVGSWCVKLSDINKDDDGCFLYVLCLLALLTNANRKHLIHAALNKPQAEVRHAGTAILTRELPREHHLRQDLL